eukprot:957939-Pelagomonas_calceolata.AAC.1
MEIAPPDPQPARKFQNFAGLGRLAVTALSNTCHSQIVTLNRLAQHGVEYYYLYQACCYTA